MKIGFIGLGRMGGNMVLRLLETGHTVVANNRSPEPTKAVMRKGAIGSNSIDELITKLPKKKIIWLMVPAGDVVDSLIKQIIPLLKRGDIIIDGGNSYYKDSIRHAKALKKKGIKFLDCGTSGGIEGARHGACMMVGGEKKVFTQVEKLFKDLCVKDGYGYMGASGAGHFVKMVHNGIEYGMMSAIAEGMNAIDKQNFKTDLKIVAKVYANGSIIEGRLMKWLLKGMDRPYYNKIPGTVPQGETEKEMELLEKLVPMPVLKQARLTRVKTRKNPSLIGRIIAVMRNEFGGHAFKKE
ncbi:6-phosphogluconate dehydrogenase (decarboxylating) [archaeon]|nr:6-phosphogluconate dehydrogenase (decarboxylating) [archaeon]|tara:strand:+ start:456 stop:1343 length:888 start_codon:yes stop_codon:yes gene_type:complete